eukprot:6395085-Prymnesium_polylepis.4
MAQVSGGGVSWHCNRQTLSRILGLGAVPHALPSMPACGDSLSRSVGHARGAWRGDSVGAALRPRGRFVPRAPLWPFLPSCRARHA